MSAYSVVNRDINDATKPRTGLSLEEAVNELFARCDYAWRIAREADGTMQLMVMSMYDEFCWAPEDFVSFNPDDQEARNEVMEIIVKCSQAETGPFMIVANG